MSPTEAEQNWIEYLEEIDRECRDLQRYQLQNFLKLDLPRFFEKADPDLNPDPEAFEQGRREEIERIKKEKPELWKKIQEARQRAAEAKGARGERA